MSEDTDQEQRKTGRRPPVVAPGLTHVKPTEKPDSSKTQSKDQVAPRTTKSLRPASPSNGHPLEGQSEPNGKTEHAVKPAKKMEVGNTASRRQRSDVFKSFSKTQPKVKAENTAGSAGTAVTSADESVRSTLCK